MAYTTSIVGSMTALLDAIATFMTGNGWTLHDSLGPHDKVFRSVGTSGKQNHIIRITSEERFLDYNAQTANFVVGETVTGATSGATGIILTDTDTGATGTMSLYETTGLFLDGEIIATASGSATANGRMRFKSYKAPNLVENALDWLIVRGYSHWNASTHVGVGEFGYWGPHAFIGQHSSSNSLRVWRPDLPSQQAVGWDLPDVPYYNYTPNAGSRYVFRNYGAWDGVRHLYSMSNEGPWNGWQHVYDFVTSTASPIANQPQGQTINSIRSGAIPVWDKERDAFYMYGVNASNNAASNWVRYLADGNFWETLAGTLGFLPAQPTNAKLCWDGGDYIYAGWSNSANMARYSIKNQNWTAMAPGPGNVNGPDSTNMASVEGIYVPRGVIPSIDEDTIWFFWDSTSAFRRYYVKSNSWDSFSFPESTSDARCPIWWDNNRYIYFNVGGGQTYVWRLDLTNIGDGWRSLPFSPEGVGNNGGVRHLEPNCGKIRGKAGDLITYHLMGDADSIRIITKLSSSSNSYWSTFGLTDSYRNPNIMTTTAPALPGSPVTINVDSTTGFFVGDHLLMLDPSTGTIRPVAIQAIPSGTTVTVAGVNTSFATGSRIFADAINCVITNDGNLAVYGHDQNGYRPDGQASGWRVTPVAPANSAIRGDPTSTGETQTWPFTVWANYHSVGGATYVSANDPGVTSAVPPQGSQIRAYGNRAQLRGILSIARSGNGSSAGEGSVLETPDGKRYLVVYPKHWVNNPDQRWCAIGPIN